MNITELFNSLKAYINSVIGDKITIINGKTVDASNSASAAANSATSAATSASNASTSASDAAGAASAAVQAAIDDLVDQSPETLDTLAELADALGNDPKFATTITALIGTKANSSDMTTALNNKANSSHTHVSSQITDAMSGTDGTATYANKLVKYGSTGHIDIYADPVFSSQVARKAYVDAQVGTRAASSHTHSEYVAKAGSAATLWTGSQSAYDALPAATKNAAGFIAVIT